MKFGQEIVRKIRDGDEEAFKLFYREYFPRVYKYAYRRVKARELAEDLTEETFLKVLRSFKYFELKEGLTLDMWIYAIERNVVRDWFRKNAGFEILPFEEKFENKLLPILQDPYSSAENEVINDYIKESLLELPAQYREVIELRFYRRKSIKSIALELNKSEGAVKVLQFRAIKALKEKIEEKLENG